MRLKSNLLDYSVPLCVRTVVWIYLKQCLVTDETSGLSVTGSGNVQEVRVT